MKHHSRLIVIAMMLAAITVCGIANGWGEDAGNASSAPAAEPAAKQPESVRVSVDEARRQAAALHAAMHSTLHLVHHHYFREDEGLPIPAAIVEQVFADMAEEQPATLRWLVVEGQAMNTDHLPQDAFEIEAAEALKAGRPSFERVESGVFRRAGPIALTNVCLKCHVPDRKTTEDRTAGLVISIPVLKE